MRDQKKRSSQRAVLSFGAVILLIAVALYSGLQIMESTVFAPSQSQSAAQNSKTIHRDGTAYFPRQDITVLMVMGIDKFGPVQASSFHQNDGAVDMVMLVIFDETAATYNVLYLNRDTMLQMPALGLGGKPAGTFYGQLALSHTYGTGLEDSCENTKKAVSDFLYGVRIDHYVSMHMDAIAIANDALGGVRVTVTEDFSAVDPSISMGSVTLRGQQAVHYVQTRREVGDQLNLSRLQRQREYMQSFLSTLQQRLDGDDSFVLETYDALSPYIVTDCSSTVLSSMLSHYKNYTPGKFVTPQGENVLGRTYYEFYPDEAALDALILELFYAPK
jgi:LCP family protein required for cell wall assembly